MRKTLSDLIARHPVAAFLVWFFTVGWAIAFTPLVVERVWGVDLPFQPFAIATTLIGGLPPLLVITWIVDGPEGLRELGRRTVKVRVPARWYAVAMLALPLPAVALALIFLGAPEASGSVLGSAVASGLLLQTVVTLLTVNLVEEVTWMGFVQARLQADRGVMVAVVATAAFFTLQHLPLLVAGGNSILVVLPLFFVLSFGFRAVTAWVYNGTASLFLVGLLHAAGNGATGGSGFAPGMLPRLYDSPSVGVLHLVAALLVGLVLIGATRGRLGASPRRHASSARPLRASGSAEGAR